MLEMHPLTFPEIPCGSHETRYDLLTLLYKGAAGTLLNKQWEQINSGVFGAPIMARLPLVKAIHDEISTLLALGRSHTTTLNKIRAIRTFYVWCDKYDKDIQKSSAEYLFREWIEHVYHRIYISKTLGSHSGYHIAKNADLIISKALGLRFGIMRTTRLESPDPKRRSRPPKAAKQDISEVLTFGQALFDISNELTLERTFAPLPVVISLRGGQQLTEWSGLRPEHKVIAFKKNNTAAISKVKETRAAWSDNPSRRYPIINLRIEAELLTFISQTGMNLAQAAKLRTGKFRYRTEEAEVLIFRVFKRRRAGEAEFKIYKEYKPYFQRYVEWRNAVTTPEDDRLFPFLGNGIIPSILAMPRFQALNQRFRLLGIKFIGPRTLRHQRVNWLLRLSQDDDLVAEMAQHTKQILITRYEEPNHQLAAVQITKFYKAADLGATASGPGKCVSINSKSELRANIQSPVEPDCITPAGCLFCEFHRDLDTEDYVWSITSFKYLKALELDHFIPPVKKPTTHPVKAIIDRITEKLEAFRQSSPLRKSWVEESELKMLEGKYHPAYESIIHLMEL